MEQVLLEYKKEFSIKEKTVSHPGMVQVFSLRSTHYEESRGAPERGTSEDAPLVALCHKEWPYGGQSPWEEEKVE